MTAVPAAARAKQLIWQRYSPYIKDAKISSESFAGLSLIDAATRILESAPEAKRAEALGSDADARAKVDQWLKKVEANDASLQDLESLDAHFRPLTFAVGSDLTVADLALLAQVHTSVASLPAAEQHKHPSLVRYVSHVSHLAAASTSATDASPSLAPFDPVFEGMPTIERKDLAKEKEAAKAAKKKKAEAAEGSAGGAKAEKAAAAAKAGASGGSGDKSALPTGQDPSASAAAKAKTDAAGAAGPAAATQEGGKAGKAKDKSAAAAAGGAKDKAAKKGGGGGGGNNSNAPAAPARALPSQVDLRVGRIVSVERHPDADALYLEKVDFGEPSGPRTILSGLVRFVPIEAMRERWVVGVCNLKPSKMRGIVSEGMLLCASSREPLPETGERGVEPIRPPQGSEPGDRVYVEGFETLMPDAQLNPKKKVWEAIQPSYTTTPNRDAAWHGAGPEHAEVESAAKPENQRLRLLRTERGACFSDTFAGATLS